METTMDDSKLRCPIYFEIPEGEIYQCVNGHIVCHTCCTHLRECPQCREPYGAKKIRVRVLEDIISEQEVDCPNKPIGCPKKVSRKELSNHADVCSFGGTKACLCKYMGYTCKYVCNSRTLQDTVQHFEKVHGAVQMPAYRGTIQLVDFGSADLQTSGVWTPYICRDSQFLVFAKVNGDSQTVSLNCAHLGENTTSKENFEVQFIINSEQVRFIEYTTLPLTFTDIESLKTTSVMQLHGDTIKQKHLIAGSLEFKVTIRPVALEHQLDRLSVEDKNVWFAFNGVDPIPAAATCINTQSISSSRTLVELWSDIPESSSRNTNNRSLAEQIEDAKVKIVSLANTKGDRCDTQ